MATKKAVKNLNNSKVLTKSKGQVEIEKTISLLESKDNLTVHELRRLANAKHKLEDRSPSKLYKAVKSDYEAKDEAIVNLLGKSKFPEFKEFVSKLPNKLLFSKWDALGVLAKCNKSAQIATKLEKQGGVQGTKAEAA